MIKRTIREYEIRHSGDEMDRLEVFHALGALAKMINDASLASVCIGSIKSDLISVTIEEVDMP